MYATEIKEYLNKKKIREKTQIGTPISQFFHSRIKKLRFLET